MSGDRYVVLGLAHVRSPWFRDVGRWATAAAIPVEFIRCVSAEEVRARFGSGRSLSALMVDAGVAGVDRDLIDLAVEAGTAVLVVDNDRAGRDWTALGATAVLPPDFHRGELLEELGRHAEAIGRVDVLPGVEDPAAAAATAGWAGQLIAVTGAGGTGSSTAALALAQGIGADHRYQGLVLLADLSLHAEQGMLHDADDVVPGLQELVEAHRTGTPTLAEVRNLVFDVPQRGYHLLLGLRRHRDWAVLRPRALQAALDSLCRSYRAVVADVDGDLEGEGECGSVEVEERNGLARAATRRAALVVVVGVPSMKGIHSQLRVIDELVGHAVDGRRILPVFNRSVRSARQRGELAKVFGELVAPISATVPSPIHLPARRSVDEALRDGVRLPGALVNPLTGATLGALDRVAELDRPVDAEPQPIRPGDLGRWADQDDIDGVA